MRDLIAAEKFYGTKKKKIAILILAIIILLAGLMVFPGNLSAPKNARIKKEIQTLMTAYNALYQKKDVEGIMALYSNDPDIIMLGAGKRGHSIGHKAIREAYQREFSAFSEIKSVECKTLSIFIAGDIVTLAAERYLTALKGSEVVNIAGGLTAVMKNSNGSWFFIQTHFSWPYEHMSLEHSVDAMKSIIGK
ncbi:MAG TPA: nuclear transport factor 2 family protein [Thermodesulfovibrionales bacterium]|jgi:ketosteroid isomerase-like protein|nr:nuclear transport factor 2 family protein [Alphaproteobacteria bacterium]HZV47666.1 nuclear transport factor 2 family protein [Thermodesulfovibrionales bacterium]